MIITCNNHEKIARLKKRLSGEFDLKDLGKLRYFLGVKFARSRKGLAMNQTKYTIDLLKEIEKIESRPLYFHKLKTQAKY